MADRAFELALGLIETRGLVAAVEAADAMTKTSEVRLVRLARTDPALITVEIVGEVAPVQSAVEAGSAAAERVGELVARHVIPRPDATLAELLELEAESRQPSTPPLPQDLEAMTVPDLRALARDQPDFPLQGREIARARKQELIDHLRAL